jgi:hypothetical protein
VPAELRADDAGCPNMGDGRESSEEQFSAGGVEVYAPADEDVHVRRIDVGLGDSRPRGWGLNLRRILVAFSPLNSQPRSTVQDDDVAGDEFDRYIHAIRVQRGSTADDGNEFEIVIDDTAGAPPATNCRTAGYNAAHLDEVEYFGEPIRCHNWTIEHKKWTARYS